MDDPDVARQLRTAELWRRRPASGLLPAVSPAPPPGAPDPTSRAPDADPAPPVLVAGWEDGATFCTAVCSTDVGLAFCRRCPEEVAARAIGTRRASSGTCPAGVRMLAFPAPAGALDQAAVLRVAPPRPQRAARISDRVHVSAATLRRSAREAEPPDGRAALRAARILRDERSLLAWQVGQRNRGADRRRTATAALAQMIATSEEFHDLYRASQRQRTELEQSRRRLDRLAREALRTQDVERARIAHQIHDTAAQSMVSAYRFLDSARASAANRRTDGSVDAHLDSAADRLRAAIGEVRAVLASLLPPGLEELGVAQAVRSRLVSLTDGTGIAGQVAGDLPRLDGWVEQAVYGMTVEAISNAVRHAAPSRIDVELAESRGRAVVVVRDDGRGFDPGPTVRRDGGGLGLLGLSRQASWLGGRATIRSRIGSGTTVRISIPLARHRVGSAPPAAPAPAATR